MTAWLNRFACLLLLFMAWTLASSAHAQVFSSLGAKGGTVVAPGNTFSAGIKGNVQVGQAGDAINTVELYREGIATPLASQYYVVSYTKYETPIDTLRSFELSAALPPGTYRLYVSATSENGLSANTPTFTVTVSPSSSFIAGLNAILSLLLDDDTGTTPPTGGTGGTGGAGGSGTGGTGGAGGGGSAGVVKLADIVIPHKNNADAGTLPGNLGVGSDGGATYAVELAVPPGTAGMQPQLSLNYSSNGGNGMVGIGWSLNGLSTIHRCAKTIAQDGVAGRINFDSADRLCLNGQRLLRTDGGNPGNDTAAIDAAYWGAGAQYRTEQESFTRVTRLASGGFKVETRDGRVHYYGSDANSAIAAQGRSDGKPLLWALARTEDRSGNFMTVTYSTDANSGEYVPTQIQYGGNSNNGQSADLAVRFEFEGRSDAQTQYMGGSRNDLRQRLSHVKTFINTASDGSGGMLVRDHAIVYGESPTSGRSMVKSMQASAVNRVTGALEYLPKTTFDWGQGSAPAMTTLPITPFYLPTPPTPAIRSNPMGASLVYGSQYQADLDGSGLTSFFSNRRYLCGIYGDACAVDSDNILQIRLPGKPEFSRTLDLAAAGLPSNSSLRILNGDLDGDGRDDLVLINRGQWHWAYCLNVPRTDGTLDFNCRYGGAGEPSLIDMRHDRRVHLILPFDTAGNSTEYFYGQGAMQQRPIHMTEASPLSTMTGFYNKAAFQMAGVELSKNGMSDISIAWKDYVAPADPAHACKPTQQTLSTDPIGAGMCMGKDIHLGVAACFNAQSGLVCHSVYQATFPGELESAAVNNDQRLNVTSSRSVGDMNGDGLTDFVYTLTNVGGVRTKSYLCQSKESGMDCQSAPALTPANPFKDYFPGSGQIGDFVGDGVARMFEVAGATQLCRNTSNGLICSDVPVPRGAGVPQAVFMDGSGLPAFLLNRDAPDNTYSTYPQSPYSVISFRGAIAQDKLIGVTNGIGQRAEVDYARGDDATVYRRFAVINGVEQRPVYPQVAQVPGVLVKQLRHSNGQGDWLRSDYHYEGAFSDAFGRGSLGFGLMSVTDRQSNIATTTIFNQTFPHIGTVKQSKTVSASMIVLDETTNSPDQQTFTHPSGAKTVFSFVGHTTTVRKDLNAGEELGKVETENIYGDGWGNLTQQTIASSGANLTFTTTTTASYNNDGSAWLLGLVGNSSVTRSDGIGGSIKRSSGNTYVPGTTLLKTETIEPDDSVYRVVTTYDRDGNPFGLANKRIQSWLDPATGAAASRTVSDTTYDSKGRFAQVVKNAEGHIQSTNYDAGTGAPLSFTDANNLVTTWIIDAFGRMTKEVRDGNETRTVRKQCDSSCPPFATVATIVESYRGNDRTAVPQVSYTDSSGHVLRTQTWGFDGRVIVADRRYDGRGRLHEEDQPRYAADAAYLARRTGYDDLNRVTSLTTIDESGAERTATTQYTGFVRTFMNALRKPRVDTVDVLGRTVQVLDALSGLTKFSYDGFGNLVQTIDPNTNQITVKFDKLGRRTDLKDPDLGWIEYKVDPVGRAWKQINPVQRANAANWSKPFTSFTFDRLDRMTSRSEPDLVSKWVYDTASTGIGQLAEAYTVLYDGTIDYRRVQTYDDRGRPSTTTLVLYGSSFTSTPTYDTWNRLATQTYRHGSDADKVFELRYNDLGYLDRVKRGALELWKGTAQDAAQRFTQAVLGNGLAQTRQYNRFSARLENASLATAANALRLTEGYGYDALGNVLQRSQYWDTASFIETFTYDDLSRLKTSQVTDLPLQTFNYFADGSLRNKTGVGSGDYAYPSQGPAAVRPHAVQSIGGLNGSFTYDDNGNQISSPGRSATWTTYDMPLKLTKGSAYSIFAYGPEHQRTRQERSDGVKVLYAGGQEVELNGANVTVKTYWPNGVGVEIDRPNQPTELNWTHADRLGSVVAISDSGGNLREKLAYDAWGKRRSVDGSSTADNVEGTTDNKGFTGHEMLDLVDLVHMNGRVYDPFTAKFLSGDLLVQDPENGQSYNRYSYVLNNPTNLTDPTGLAAIDAEAAQIEEDKRKHHEVQQAPESNLDQPREFNGDIGKAASRVTTASIKERAIISDTQDHIGGSNDGSVQVFKRHTVREPAPLRYYGTADQIMGQWIDFDGISRTFQMMGVSEKWSDRLSFASAFVNPKDLLRRGTTGLFSKVGRACSCCFSAGTSIATADGETDIESIQVGQLVYARDEVSGQTELKPVTQLITTEEKPVYELVTRSRTGTEARLEVTDNHPFWVKGGGWVESAKLSPGMELIDLSGNIVLVESLHGTGRLEKTFNLTVADFHTFFAGKHRALVHNCGCLSGANSAAHALYKAELRAAMSKPAVTDSALAKIMSKLYRENAKIGSGSTAAAVRFERETGEAVGGAMHTKKAEDSIKELNTWLARNPGASANDRAAAENVILDMMDALGQLK